MIRLVYVSQLDPAVDEKGLKAIVEHAAQRNATIGVTGMLALEGRRICQILEGGQDAVLALFVKISGDARHDDVVELDRREISERKFANWSMVRRPMVDVVVAAFSD